MHHHGPGARRRRPGHRGPHPRRHRRAVAPGLGARAEAGRRTTRCSSTSCTRVDPERAHHLGFAGIRAARFATRTYPGPATRPRHRLGLTFPSALGLAAGFDKDAVGIDALPALGFGFVEVGTVTAASRSPATRSRGCSGCPPTAPHQSHGLQQRRRRGGAGRLARRAARRTPGWASTSARPRRPADDEAAARRLRASARLLAPLADYLVVNVSSPNTPGLRDLQAVEQLRPLLVAVRLR